MLIINWTVIYYRTIFQEVPFAVRIIYLLNDYPEPYAWLSETVIRIHTIFQKSTDYIKRNRLEWVCVFYDVFSIFFTPCHPFYYDLKHRKIIRNSTPNLQRILYSYYYVSDTQGNKLKKFQAWQRRSAVSTGLSELNTELDFADLKNSFQKRKY